MNILEYIFDNKDFFNKVAVYENEKTLTYGELFTLSKELAQEISVLHNDTTNVGIYMPSGINYLVVLFGIWLSGKTAVPLNPNFTFQETMALTKSSEVSAIITHINYKEKLQNITCSLLTYEQSEKNISINDEVFHIPINNPLALVVPTSGTTGNPKLVPLTHENLYYKAQDFINGFNLKENTCELTILPITTVSVLASQGLPVLISKGTIVIYAEAINPIRVGQLIEAYNVNITGMTPTLFNVFLKSNKVPWDSLNKLDVIGIGGENIQKGLIENIETMVGKGKVIPLYGLTETTSSIVGNVNDPKKPIKSVGKIYPSLEISIVKENNEIAEIGEVGEILVKGPSISNEYYKSELNTETNYTNGYFKTGDLGMLDEENYLYVLGRKKNIIISGGQNIHPEEVEEYLLLFEDIKQVLVYGEEDEILGEIPLAVIVPENIKNFSLESLKSHCFKGLAGYKVPKDFQVVEHIDLIGMGKINRYVKK